MKEKKETPLDLATKYYKEFQDWLVTLRPYHTERFDRNYRQYNAYATTEGTESKISDPVAPEKIEQVVQRLFERDPKFYVYGRGKNLPKEITDIITGTVDYLWNSPEAIQASGSMRSRLKVIGREFLITGNCVVETFFNSKTNMPDVQLIPIEDVVFDPTKTLKTSPVYYVRKFVSLDYLKENREVVEKNGTKKGLFKNIEKVLKLLADKDKKTNDTRDNSVNRSGSDNYTKKEDEIILITRYKGQEVCRFITGEDEAVTIEEFINEILEDDPLDIAMDVEVPKEPYAFGLLDKINPITKTKDLFINQLVAYGSKVLNPPLFVDPSLAPVNRATLKNAWRLGGIVFANSKQAQHQPMPPIGSFGFDMLSYLQQRADQVAGVGAYLSGIPNQESDKTQGTATGIQVLQSQAQTPVNDRQQNLEESIIMPVINKWLKMKGALMTQNEILDVIISGSTPRWVKITKGLLTGKATIYDLLEAELLNEEEMMEMEALMVANGQDPQKELQIDTDWIVNVETGSMAEVDTTSEINNLKEWAGFRIQVGLPTDMEKVSQELATRAKIKDPEQYIPKQDPMAPNGGMVGPQSPMMIGSTPVEGFDQNGQSMAPQGMPQQNNMPMQMPQQMPMAQGV